MTTQVLRPNTDVSGTANFTATGAASLLAALTDNLDSSYIRKAGTGAKAYITGFADYTILANQMVKQVRLRARCATPTSASKVDLQLGATVSGKVVYFPSMSIRGAVAIGEVVGPWQSAAPNGVAWSQTILNALRCQIIDYKDTADIGYLYELYADVELASQPTLTVDSPTLTVSDTSAPTVTWTMSDADGQAQAFYEVKVFSAAQYSAGGFSADTSEPTWTSGVVSSVEPSRQVGTYLANGSWRAYVRAGKSVNGQAYFSNWGYTAFTVTLTTPAVPTVVVTYSEPLGRVQATLTGTVSASFTYQRLQLQRSDDAGTTWADVRYGSDIIPNGSIVAALDDYEARRGNTAYYRARAIGYVGANVIASAWSASATVAVTNDGKWWAKAITNPLINMANIRVLVGLDVQQDEDVAVFRPIGRRTAVVIAGTLYGEDGTYRIKSAGDDEWAAVAAIVQHQGTLLMQAPDGTQKYVRFTSRAWTETGGVAHLLREVRVNFVEVDS